MLRWRIMIPVSWFINHIGWGTIIIIEKTKGYFRMEFLPPPPPSFHWLDWRSLNLHFFHRIHISQLIIMVTQYGKSLFSISFVLDGFWIQIEFPSLPLNQTKAKYLFLWHYNKGSWNNSPFTRDLIDSKWHITRCSSAQLKNPIHSYPQYFERPN